MGLIMKAIFWSSYSELSTSRNFDPKYGQFEKSCLTLANHCFQQALRCLSSSRYLGALTVKSSLNAILIPNMANLENAVTRL